MRKFITSLLCLSALVASAVSPLQKPSPNPDGTLREVPLRTLKQKSDPEKEGRRGIVSPDNSLSLPASIGFSVNDMNSNYIKVDANNDGCTWKYESDYSMGGTACYESTRASGGADDWLILPFIDFPSASASYSISLQTKKLYLPESFEVCLSPTTDINDAIVLGTFSDIPNNFTPVFVDFGVPAAGKYCIMIHANSPAKGLSLYVTDVKVSQNEEDRFTVPFSMTPTMEEVKYLTFIDANNDGITWVYDSANVGVSYTTNSANPNAADDYVLFPEIDIPEAGNYKFCWSPIVTSNYFTESMEVLLGQGDDPSNFNLIYKDTSINGDSSYPREVVFYISEPGAWRPAIRCTSKANQYKLLVKNFTLEATDDSPATALPYSHPGVLSMTANSPAFTKAFLLPASTKIKVNFDHQGASMKVGLSKAPSAVAPSPLFEVEEGVTAVSEKFNSAGDGIYYLVFTSTGAASVNNLNISVYNEADEAYQLPFSIQPTAEEFKEFMVVNANNDGSTWTYYDQFGAPRYNYSNSEKADDWLIFPAVNVPSSEQMINFSLQVRGMGTSFAETFEVWEGATTDISDMRKIYTSPEVRNEEFEDFGFSFAPSHEGITYFAVRATSEPRQFHIFVKNFLIETDSRSVNIPMPVSNLEAEGLPEGSQQAKITFTMPTLTEGGKTLEAESALIAKVKSAYETKSVSGLPGEEITCTIENGQGLGEISVVVSNSEGDSNESKVNVFTGQHIPNYVTDFKIVADETNRQATLSWSLSNQGVDGGYVDPSQVSYTILHASGGSNLIKVAETEKGVYSFTYTIPESYPLQMHYFSVVASNVAGDGPYPTTGTGIVLGKPHTIPSVEDLSSGTIELGPVGMTFPDETYTLNWYFDNPAYAFDEAVNESGHALIAFTEEEGAARGRLHLPKFDTRTQNGARVVLRLFNYPHFAPTGVYANTFDSTAIKIGDIAPSQETGWVEYSLPLPDSLMNRQWVEIYIDFGFDGSNDDEIWMLDRFGVENYYNKELDLRPIQVHTRIKANEKSVWKFLAGNYGKQSFSFEVPTLNFTTENGDVQQFAATTPVDEEIRLNPGETIELIYEPVADTSMEGQCYYDITALVDGDINMVNNTLFGELTIWVQEEFVVRDLTAEIGEGNDVILNWTAPQNDWGILYMDNLESWDYSSQLGLFTNYDGDKLPTLMFVGVTFPSMGYPKAWQVFDYEDGGFDYPYAGYLGTVKSLIVFAPGDNISPADDWLISPEVKGGTEVEFQVRPLSYEYGRETLEIYYSSTGNEIEDFKLISTYKTLFGEKGKVPYWEEVKVTLPEDAHFFAIRYVSAGIFGVQLDDVIYTPAQAEREEDRDSLTYTIFRDGEPIATGVQGTTFTDDYHRTATYNVAAEKVYGGLHPLSNSVRAILTGISDASVGSALNVSSSEGYLIVKGAENCTMTIVAADGKTVYSTSAAASEERIPLTTGFYVVNVEGHNPVKAIVK